MTRMSLPLLAVFFALQLLTVGCSWAAVTNQSAQPIYIKPERGDTPIRVNPGETYKGRQDGIMVPAQKPGKVYKTVDNVDARVDADGEVHPSAHNLQGVVGLAAQVFFGGWLDEPPLRDIGEWQKSFDKAKEIAR